jgi:Fe-S cluster assembly protein SufD
MKKVKIDPAEMKDWYVSAFSAFENRLNGSREIPFHDIRRSALSKFAELGFPGRRDEDWKYTNVSPLLKHKFRMADRPAKVSADTVQKFTFKGMTKNVLVFVNGRYSQELSSAGLAAKGVVVESLENGLKERSGIIEKHISKYAGFDSQTFVALNTAFASDGAFIYLPDNAIVEEPVHLLYISDPSEASFFASPRNLIIGGRNSQIKVLESHHGLGEKAYFNNAVTEVVVQENARINHMRVQDESPGAYHITSLQAYQERDSYYSLVNVDLGGALVRNNLSIKLDAENCEAHIIGFYLGGGKQHMDNHTAIDHAKPNCFSNELYKGILGGKARGVFSGKIFVHPDAQKTNAYQNNKALILSDDAVINTKPQLEIFADDVKCSHGATVGQLDKEALFYLRSRGIAEEKANSILQYAFASDVFNYIPIEAVKERLNEIILNRLDQL